VITWKAVWLDLKPYLSCCGQHPCVLLIGAMRYLSYVSFMVARQLRYKQYALRTSRLGKFT
jgi:hypothetical protein